MSVCLVIIVHVVQWKDKAHGPDKPQAMRSLVAVEPWLAPSLPAGLGHTRQQAGMRHLTKHMP